MNSVHHVTNGDDFSAGLVWPKDKFKHFIVSLLPDNTGVLIQQLFTSHGHSFLLSLIFSTVLLSSFLPKTSAATVGFGSTLECVSNSAPYPVSSFRRAAGVDG